MQTFRSTGSSRRSLPGAFEKMDFVPKPEKILQKSKMLKQGESDTLRFHAPKEAG